MVFELQKVPPMAAKKKNLIPLVVILVVFALGALWVILQYRDWGQRHRTRAIAAQCQAALDQLEKSRRARSAWTSSSAS